ncbi:hypothetical protein Pmani_021151 [Petrolisthes manimaculis]|uniref:C-type lectin domain-containing protein n=1 Tax=Petrolisthes manimaculis TaxID=1843537 RepID=A0AAE1PEQ5_9EUCA|nr:hypothetical protein Pmani_021151 [Petrolisthes manimaculis]
MIKFVDVCEGVEVLTFQEDRVARSETLAWYRGDVDPNTHLHSLTLCARFFLFTIHSRSTFFMLMNGRGEDGLLEGDLWVNRVRIVMARHYNFQLLKEKLWAYRFSCNLSQVLKAPLNSQPDQEPSIMFPTREFLNSCNKTDLQNRCKELGITKIWVNKDQLIDMILQSTSNHTIDTTQSVSVSPAELPVSPHTDNTHPSLEPEVTHPPALSAALNEVPNPFITPDVIITPEDTHPSDMQEAANSSSTPGEASALVTPDVGNYSSVGDTQLSDVQVITPTPTSASTSQSLPSSLTTSCDDLWLTPLTLGEQRLDPTQPGATQRTYALPSEASLARPLLPNTRLSVPPLGYERFVSAPTIPGVSVMDEETKAKICKMEKSIEHILSKLETKDLEMELLATEVKTAYATIELLQKRVNELELKNKEENIKPDSLPPNNCLLLGDSNTQHVLRSDLGNNCTVRTINMSTFVKLRNWVTHNLTRLPSTCVINCGLYDLLDDLTPEVILDNVGSLISDLKEKYSNMKIYVCTIAPAPVSRENICNINNYNEHLARWADVNGVTLINTSPMFKLSTGDIDELCFNTEKDTTPLILNRLGVIRLLDAIDKQCPEFQLCSDWKGLKRKTPVFADYNSNRYLQFKKKNDTQQSHSRQYNTSYPLPLLTTDLSNTAPQPHYTQPSPIYPPLPNQQRGDQAQYLPHPTQSPPSRTERHPQPPPRAPHNPQYPSPPLSHPPPKTYASVTSTPTDVSHRNWYTPPQPSVSHLGSPQYEANVPRQHTRHPVQPQSFRSRERQTAPHTPHYKHNTWTWHHLCFTYDHEKHLISTYVDGDLNNEQVYEVARSIHGNGVRLGQGTQSQRSFSGHLTQVNVWDRSLSESEVALPDLCSRPSGLTYFWFPSLPFKTALYLCQALGSHLPSATDMQEVKTLFGEAETKFNRTHSCYTDLWTAPTDREQEGTWKIGDNTLQEDIAWTPNEPNGLQYENCVSIIPNGAWDVNCKTNKKCVACTFEDQQRFSLLGTCEDELRNVYFMVFQYSVNELIFMGYGAYHIRLEDGVWEWVDVVKNITVAYMQDSSSEYPMGRRSWHLEKSVCGQESGGLRTLTLTPCSPQEFTCNDATCVPLTHRCDLKYDCRDNSDELDCQLVSFPEGYQKHLPPRNPVDPQAGLDITFSLGVESLEVTTLAMTMEVSYKLQLIWVDSRLQYQNLKMNEALNILDQTTMNNLWIPQVSFINTVDNKHTLIDDDTVILVSRLGEAVGRDEAAHAEVDIYPGGRDTLRARRKYGTVFMCDFDLSLYPFDAQLCFMYFRITSASSSFLTFHLDNSTVLNSANKLLIEYEVGTLRLEKGQGDDDDDFSDLKVMVPLKRRYGYAILNIYLPTLVLLIVNYVTLYFRPAIFDTRMMAALTVQLVIATLFSQVSASLPKTSYFKMVDLWFIFCIGITFLTIVLHVVVDAAINNHNNNNHHHNNKLFRITNVVPSDPHKPNKYDPVLCGKGSSSNNSNNSNSSGGVVGGVEGKASVSQGQGVVKGGGSRARNTVVITRLMYMRSVSDSLKRSVLREGEGGEEKTMTP